MNQNRRWNLDTRVKGDVDASVHGLTSIARIPIFAQACELHLLSTSIITRHTLTVVLTRLGCAHSPRQIASRAESAHWTEAHGSMVDHTHASRPRRAVALQLLLAPFSRPAIVTLTHTYWCIVLSMSATPVVTLRRARALCLAQWNVQAKGQPMNWKEIEANGKEPGDSIKEGFPLIRIDSDRILLGRVSGSSGVQ